MMFGSVRQQQSLGAGRTPSTQSEPVEIDGYVTDGRRLYWVLASPSWSKRVAFTLLEDCATLEVYVLTAAEVATLCLRRVVPLADIC